MDGRKAGVRVGNNRKINTKKLYTKIIRQKVNLSLEFDFNDFIIFLMTYF